MLDSPYHNGQKGHDSKIRTYIMGLYDHNVNIRVSAAQALVKIGQAAIPQLLDVLRDSSDEVRRFAASILAEIGWEPFAEEDLLLYLYASQAWDTLVNMKNAAIPVFEMALTDENFYVRTSAALSLGEIAHDASIPLLLTAMQDTNSYVRSAAARSLGQFQQPDVLATLGQAIQDADKSVRGAAAGSLLAIGASAIETLVNAFETCDWYYRREVAQALTTLGKPTVKYLIPLLQNPDIAYEAAQLLKAFDVDPTDYGYQDEVADVG